MHIYYLIGLNSDIGKTSGFLQRNTTYERGMHFCLRNAAPQNSRFRRFYNRFNRLQTIAIPE